MRKILLLLFISSLICAETSKVIDVVDGDTFKLSNGDVIRPIGINCPELKSKCKLEVKIAESSKRYTEKKLLGKVVTLEQDSISTDLDYFGRKLRYVYYDSDTGYVCFNEEIINAGYAECFEEYKFDKMEYYLTLEKKAIKNRKGLWH